jgi:Laminin G domain
LSSIAPVIVGVVVGALVGMMSPAVADDLSTIAAQAPGIVSIARTDATSITVTFSNASDKNVNSYTIVLNNGAPAINNAVSPQLITGLKQDTTYVVNVYGSNGVDTAGNLNNSIYLPPSAPSTDTALNFTASGQYASVVDSPRVDFADQFTAEAWINPASGCATTTCVIFNKGNSVTLELVNNQIEYEIDGNGNAPAAPTWRFIATGISVVDGQWQHIALQKSSTNNSATGVQIGVNGQTVYTGAAYNCTSGCASSVSNTNRAFTIGGLQDTTTAESGKFLGAIDEFRLRTSALPDYAQLFDMDNYLDGFSGEVLHYDFNEGSGGVAYNRNPTSTGATDLTVVGSPTWVTTNVQATVNKVTTATFRRPYLTSYGGWHVPVGVSSINELIVAGGGAGGFGDSSLNWSGGGGGAGGVVNDTAIVTPDSFATLYVGMGEFPSKTACQNLSAGGQDSVFNSATMSGGGQGGCEVDISHIFNPTSGGSGGGGQAQTSNGNNTAVGAAANDPTHFGHAGGNGHAANTATYGVYNQASGGGGGAGAAGGNGVGGNVTSVATETAGNGGNAGDGGVGLLSTISGSSLWYGGGGGGTVRVVQGTAGSGGTGGGGTASIGSTFAGDGGAGTGGGGGATSGAADYAGTGGSGIIILRWTQPLLPLIISANDSSITYPASTAVSKSYIAAGNPNAGETFTVTYTYSQNGNTVAFAALVPGIYLVTPCITATSTGAIASGCQLNDYSSVTYNTGTFTYLKEARANFAIAGNLLAPHSALTGILGETNTLFVTGTNPGPDTSTSSVSYYLATSGSDSGCALSTDSHGVHLYDAYAGSDPGTCVVSASIAASANYLAASDTQTVLFHKLQSIYAIQTIMAGSHTLIIQSGPTPVVIVIPITAGDSSTTTTAPTITSISIAGSTSTTEVITISGAGFWSPGVNDIVTFFDVSAAINNSYVTVVTSSNPQTITVRIPASWFTANSVGSGIDMGPVVVETPSGTALSLADATTQ